MEWPVARGAWPGPFTERVRGHRRVGPVPTHQELRPFTTAAAIAAIIGVAITAYSAYSQGEAQAAQARRQSKLAEQQGEYARQVAAADAETKRRQYDRVLGAQRARYGASGVIPGEGTPLLAMMESEEEAALDVARVRHGGAVAAQGFGLESQDLLRAGRQARRQGMLRASGALLTGVRYGATAYSGGGGAVASPSAGTGYT